MFLLLPDSTLIEIINENIDNLQNDSTYGSNETMQRKVKRPVKIRIGKFFSFD